MKKATFRASVRNGPATLITGWQLKCGAVVHRSVFGGGPKGLWPQRYDDCWSVSDPVSGAAIVLQEWSMGDALAAYRRLRIAHGAGFAAALAVKRQEVARQIAAKRATP